MAVGSVDVDVLIAGGGPVGLATAIEARLAGLSATVVEPRSGTIDKACGEGLMPGAIGALERLGVDPDGMPIRGFSYLDGTRRVNYRFRGDEGRGVRRTTLHAALRARASEVGVQILPGRVEQIAQDRFGVTAAGLRASWLIGADGLHSAVRRAAHLEASTPAARSTRGRRYGLRQHFEVAPWTDLVEVHWGAASEAYVTPVTENTVGVAILAPRGTSYPEALAAFRELSHRLDGAPTAGPVRGAGPLRQRTKARTSGRVLLVGDASGYVDALTGEGLRVGFAQARVAVEALKRGDVSLYERSWRTETRDFRLLTGALLAGAMSPLRRGIVPLASAVPALFGAGVERLAR